VNQPKPKPAELAPVQYSLILGIRRIKTGSFAGLWELTELDANHSVKRVIIDADTRGLVVSLAARAIGNAV
jgi:hypothetical protein